MTNALNLRPLTGRKIVVTDVNRNEATGTLRRTADGFFYLEGQTGDAPGAWISATAA